MEKVSLATPWGTFLTLWSPQGLKSLLFPPQRSGRKPSKEIEKALENLLNRYLSGEQVDFAPIPLDLSSATPFQCKVWEETRSIPYGTTLTYGQLAARLGIPKGARAVGQALKKNPTPIIIPCHRVVGQKGLTGFSGGLNWKKRLISLESGG